MGLIQEICIVGIRTAVLQVLVIKMEKDLDAIRQIVLYSELRRWANNSEKGVKEKQIVDEVDKQLSAYIDKIMEDNK